MTKTLDLIAAINTFDPGRNPTRLSDLCRHICPSAPRAQLALKILHIIADEGLASQINPAIRHELDGLFSLEAILLTKILKKINNNRA